MSSQSDFFLVASRLIPPSSPCTTRSWRQSTLVTSALSSFWVLNPSAAFDTVHHQILFADWLRRKRKWTVSWSTQCGLQRPSRICVRSSEVHRIYRGPDGPDPHATQVIASTTMTHAALTVDRLQHCVAEIKFNRWCSSRRLQMNPHKTELIWFGSRTNLQNLAALPGTSSLTVTHDFVQGVNAVGPTRPRSHVE